MTSMPLTNLAQVFTRRLFHVAGCLGVDVFRAEPGFVQRPGIRERADAAPDRRQARARKLAKAAHVAIAIEAPASGWSMRADISTLSGEGIGRPAARCSNGLFGIVSRTLRSGVMPTSDAPSRSFSAFWPIDRRQSDVRQSRGASDDIGVLVAVAGEDECARSSPRGMQARATSQMLRRCPPRRSRRK